VVAFYHNGRPSGLSIDRDGNLIVSDSHYHCFRIYSPEGRELRAFGGQAGTAPGQFGYISDVV
jgi:sugar lactone lactonase YvrE